jgi:hypothetical protein
MLCKGSYLKARKINNGRKHGGECIYCGQFFNQYDLSGAYKMYIPKHNKILFSLNKDKETESNDNE